MYLFDTDILSHLAKRRRSSILIERLRSTPPAAQFTSAVTVGEIYAGIYRTETRASLLRYYEERVFPQLTVLDYERESAKVFGWIKSVLEKQGRPRSDADLQIAAIAVQHHLTLVTGNVKHFKGIAGLAVENWFEPARD
jgi:predicted nucleic acid-binding protein